MRLPVAGGDLVADKGIARGCVGNAKQRLRKAHQRHAFLAGQRIFVHQPLDTRPGVLRPKRGDQLPGGIPDIEAHGFRQRRPFQQRLQAFRLWLAVGGRDQLP